MKNKFNSPQVKASIIILNYFGEKVIAETINSVLNQKYSKNRYEIIIPDNASKDGSLSILNTFSKKYSNIKILPFRKNYGFAGGNGRAIKKARGEYTILLNNDCLVDPNWLKDLIKCADQDPNIFSVSSKVLIYPKYFTITFKCPSTLLSCRLFNSKLLRFGKEDHIDIPFKNENNFYTIDIPFEAKNDSQLQIDLEFREEITTFPKLNKDVDYHFENVKNKSNTLRLFLNTTNPLFIEKSFNKIQNAGSIVFQDGYGRDIGATVKNQTGDYEKDFGQYDQDREVCSTCGAASLYRRSIIDKIGFLTDDFFMYYEDTELSERARLAGYKNYYCHTATARHLHALSSHEWSSFFIFHTEKGRLLHVYYHFPLKIFLKEYFHFTRFAFLRLGHNIIFDRRHLDKDMQYLNVAIYFIKNIIFLIKRKKTLNQNNVITINSFYQQILDGYWVKN